jgi:TetR/AcrR family transcriptional repressor of lmrAB and yxaGH operons
VARLAKHENALVTAAAELFRKQGYAATGTAEILKRSNAPRGSLYHYFPEGKEQVAAAAIAMASKMLTRTIKEIASEVTTTADFITAYAEKLGGWLEKSDYRDGNPITTVVLENVPNSTLITAEAEKSYDIWCLKIGEQLALDGWPEERRQATAALILSALDGALVGARIKRDKQVIIDVAGELAFLISRK